MKNDLLEAALMPKRPVTGLFSTTAGIGPTSQPAPFVKSVPRAGKPGSALLGTTNFGGTMPVSQKTDLHYRAVREVLACNPEVNDRMRVEMALPARLMMPWTMRPINLPWTTGEWDPETSETIWRNFRGDIATCLIGLDKNEATNMPGHLAGPNSRRTWKRINHVGQMTLASVGWADPIESPGLAARAGVRPSNLTVFMAASFVWQHLTDTGYLALEQGSLFHRTYEALASIVAMENDLETLQKARKSALKRFDTMMSFLKQQGYYS